MKKKLIFFLLFLCATMKVFAQAVVPTPFITTWKSDNAGSASTQLVLPISGRDYQIHWWLKSDSAQVNGSEIAAGTTFSYTINLPQSGVYGVAASKGTGYLNYIHFSNTGDKLKLLEVNQWGNNPWTSMQYAFYGCTNLTILATDLPDLSQVANVSVMFGGCSSIASIPNIENWDVSNVTDMSWMFYNAAAFDHPLNNWNVSKVANISAMFYNATAFNQPLNNWNVSNVTDMSYMFNEATAFNQPLNNWNVGNVTNMSSMFYGAAAFNQPLNNWDVGNVTNMHWMFTNAAAFNQPLDKWNVSNVINMRAMFQGALGFNQPLNKWNVSNVTDMSYMLSNATTFNQSIGNWDIRNVSQMQFIFHYSAIDCANITRTLQGWAANPNTPNNITLGAYGVNYAPQAVDALNTLRNDKGWTITIGSEVNCEALPVSLVHFKAAVKEQLVQLEWATALEENHDFFEVQRSHDAVQWIPLSQITSAGNTTTTQNYTTSDPTPLSGTSYYRLKMVDRDGTFEYSTIRSVAFESALTAGFMYPNPAVNTITFQNLPEGMVRIYNTFGQLVKQVYITSLQTTVAVSDLPAGTYTVQNQQGWSSTLVKIP